MNMAYREWDRLCAHARSLDAELTETDKMEIAEYITTHTQVADFIKE